MGTNLPIPAPDYFSPASQAEKLAFVAALMLLPHRDEHVDKRILHGMFMTAIEGTSKWALTTALGRIAKGGLGHAFCPSYAEVRPFIDEVMRPIYQQLRQHQVAADTLAERERLAAVHQSKTPEARERIAARVERFKREAAETDAAIRKEADDAARAESRSHNGISSETVAALRNRPLPKTTKTAADAAERVFRELQIPKPPDKPIPKVEPSDAQKRFGLEIDENGVVISEALKRRLGKPAPEPVRPDPDKVDDSFRRLNQRRREQGKPPVRPASTMDIREKRREP